MYKVFVVFAREYKTQIQSKAFIISLVLMPLLMTGSIVAQRFAGEQVDVEDRRIVVIDHSEVLVDELMSSANQRNKNEVFDEDGKQIRPRILLESVKPTEDLQAQRLDLSDRVRANQLFAFVEIGPGVVKGDVGEAQGRVRYHSNRPTEREVRRWLQSSVNQIVQARRFQQANLPRDAVLEATRPVPVEHLGLLSQSESGETIEAETADEIAVFVVPFGMMMLMFMGVMVGATPLLQAIVEEKMQRIADVLLGCVSPFQLMLGKLLGVVAVSLTMIGVYLVGGYCVLYYLDKADIISAGQIAWLLPYAFLAILMFGSLFCAIGASCSEIKDAQSLMTPVMILIVLPMFFLRPVMEAPSGTLATALSFVPPLTPMFMIVRMGIPPGIPVWQPVVGMIGVLAFTALCVFAAARIFRVGILMQGKPPNLSEMLRWAIHG
jgi:ABC-2 type transport system permease protein